MEAASKHQCKKHECQCGFCYPEDVLEGAKVHVQRMVSRYCSILFVPPGQYSLRSDSTKSPCPPFSNTRNIERTSYAIVATACVSRCNSRGDTRSIRMR